ncbi:DNA segregation ATPase FtsK/SpoIIIE, S-DNA-T family [Parafrankia irregularis]|uniref:DNA segregation ATPase FtsK/SpoIIIE, S-DNA-T family n=1 Tax=Parafrankia irregularis TaxID=795642 RepID=A0A0S4QIQ5_9ACTN|nr:MULTISPECIES: FtsK/SpoIIIE domain-containing protein [Parafrankia]MBE3204116.1 FHA domain-containing protein [Parafrankia sp. CH37]CUU55007.1 DNA segregation ATPase FtsK/SpoIIIE, S-DNA-T family [Parafrankia irregularis]
MDLDLELVDGDGGRHRVWVDAGPRTRVGDVRAAVRALQAADRALFLGGTQLDDDSTLRDAGLMPGAVVGLGHPAAEPTSPAAADAPGPWELAVVGGLDAGLTVPLPAGGDVRIGRGPASDIVLDDPEVSREHAGLTITAPETVELRDLDSRNGVAWDGFRLDGPAVLREADVFQLGETVLALRRPAHPAALLSPDPGEFGWLVNRPPRIPGARAEPVFDAPAAPTEPRAFRFPVASVVLPLIAAAVMFLVMPGARYYLAFMVLSPVMLLVSAWSDRRGGRAEYRRLTAEHDQVLERLDADLRAHATESGRRLRAEFPDPATLLAIAQGPGGRLWERRPRDEDFLLLRCGLVDRALAARVTGAAPAVTMPTCRLVPELVDLPTLGVVGLAGPRPTVLALSRALLVQLAVLHDPDTVGLVLLTSRPDAAPAWEWLLWLEHLRPGATAAGGPWRLVGADTDQAEARIAQLRTIIAGRRAAAGGALAGSATVDGPEVDGPATDGRTYVVVVDGARQARSLRGFTDLLRDGPTARVYVLCLDDEPEGLPDECRATLAARGAGGSRLRVSQPGAEPVDSVLADGVSAELAGRIARALRPLRLLGSAQGAELPATVRYTELAKAASVTALARPAGPSTRMLLGVGVDGPVSADLRRDGPHALVAGTSGAGKSELLQTMIASLAQTNSPDALTFLLVDYKGGSAFTAAAALPHCVGLVTDLDGHHANRVLDSLGAELRRRERLLAVAGARDIDELWALAEREPVAGPGRAGPGLPRLVVIVDEFATLVEEVPDFVPGLVGIGMRGRSLGIHLILATQRPAGVVTPDLRANVNLRICLRVTSGEDSTDVIGVPDAAQLSSAQPGRAYLRTGHRELALFQAARVGGPALADPARPGEAAGTAGPAGAGIPRVVARGLAEAGAVCRAVAPEATSNRTDLDVIISDLRVAAERDGFTGPRRPWLDPLPEVLTGAELAAFPTGGDPSAACAGAGTDAQAGTGTGAGTTVRLAIGLADLPSEQLQRRFVLDLERTGCVAVIGTVRSGRSTALRTVAASLIQAAGPEDAHLYVIDCGNGGLRSLAALPHTGAVIDGADSARLDRLVAFLDQEITRRRERLAAAGHSSLAEQRSAAAPADRLPYLVVLLDQIEAFQARYNEIDGGRLVEAVERLLRHGPSVGITVLFSTDRSGFGYRLSGLVESRLVLRQADREDYSICGVDRRGVPTRMPTGRALWAATGEQVQIARHDPADIGALAAGLAGRPPIPAGRGPRRLDPLPERVIQTELAGPAGPARSPGVCAPAVGGDELAAVDIDLAALGGCFVVAGPPGSGRSGALVSIVTTLRGRAGGELPVIALAPRPSPLRGLAGLPGVRAVVENSAELARRLEEARDARTAVAVVVDDAELVDELGVSDLLEAFLRGARDTGSLLVLAGTTEDLVAARYRGWIAGTRRSRSGLLLCPAQPSDGEVFDLRLPRSVLGQWPAGRALLVERGRHQFVQVLDHGDPRTAAATTGAGAGVRS